jgi:signal-transduction protein with cAMP-binding, CBS, and nucleotidyltransferase domain
MPFLTPYDHESVASLLKIHQVMKMPPRLREERDMEILDSCLGKTRFFSKFPPYLRGKLYNECFMATYPKGKVLIKEGSTADLCFILLTGECAQYTQASLKLPRPTVVSITELGHSMGDFLVLDGEETRTHSISCVMRTTVLYIQKSEWTKIFREAKMYELYQMDLMATIPAFKGLTKPELSKLSSKG